MGNYTNEELKEEDFSNNVCIYRHIEMDKLNIISGDIKFHEYKELVEKCINNNDTREIVLQEDVIKPFIKALNVELDVVNVANKGPDTKNHDYLQYSGTYQDGNKEKPATPDLVIAKNWNWHNRENKVDYLAVVEIKSFNSNQSIFDKDFSKYGDRLKKQIKQHLSAKINKKLILTDTLKWEFYINDQDNSGHFNPIRTIELCNHKRVWKKGKIKKVEDEVIEELFGDKIEYEENPKVFEELKEYIVEFLSIVHEDY